MHQVTKLPNLSSPACKTSQSHCLRSVPDHHQSKEHISAAYEVICMTDQIASRVYFLLAQDASSARRRDIPQYTHNGLSSLVSTIEFSYPKGMLI